MSMNMHALESESGERKLGELMCGSESSKIEVWARKTDDGGELLDLVEYSWGSGIGWYPQKRLMLDAAQVEHLRGLLEPPKPKPALAAPRLRTAPAAEREGNVIRLAFPA